MCCGERHFGPAKKYLMRICVYTGSKEIEDDEDKSRLGVVAKTIYMEKTKDLI